MKSCGLTGAQALTWLVKGLPPQDLPDPLWDALALCADGVALAAAEVVRLREVERAARAAQKELEMEDLLDARMDGPLGALVRVLAREK